MVIEENEIYRKGESVSHRFFGLGVVCDYQVTEHPESDHNRVRVRFQDGSEKWLVTAPGYLRREAVGSTEVPAKQVTPELANPLSSPKAFRSHDRQEKPERLEVKADGQSRRGMLKLMAGMFAAAPAIAAGKSHAANARRRLPVLETRIAGFAYHQGGTCREYIRPGDSLCLRRQPGNRHDHKAIEVVWDGYMIGYVPMSHNVALSRLMDGRERVFAEVERLLDRSWEPVIFTVYLEI